MSSNTKNLFESMTRRRVSCPQVTQQLWDAIKNIRNQRQVPTAERIQKFMLKEFGVSEEEVVRQLNHCVRDGLIEITKRTISKGNYIGSEQEGYKLPLLSLKPDDFDWYCFDCHRAGDVICCSRPNCLRVYHLACISSMELPEGAFVCHVCKMCEVTPDKFQMKKSKLNRLLGYTLQRLKSKYPLTLKDQRLPPPNKNLLVSDRLAQVLTPPTIPAPDENEAWRTHLLIARDMNLTIMEDKIDQHRYKLLEEFHVDALNIVHNMVIYNGVDSAVADIARQMLRDCIQDLHEIRLCLDCYKQSHGDKKKLWFCKPCRKPHELVYAKQFGFPYWPAKVIKVEEEQYDVRFFGDQHLRALIPKAHIRPISVNIHTLQVKRSSAWNKACEELKKHQELLEKARVATDNFTKFIDSSSSSEYESIDTEVEWQIERENRLKRQKAIMERHNAGLLKQKVKRRSSSVASSPKVASQSSAASKKKRGRPNKPGGAGSGSELTGNATSKSKRGRKRKEVYEFSSDSLDSFSFTNSSKNESQTKKNTDEIFDELLKSGAEKPKPVNSRGDAPKEDGSKVDANDMKSKKWLATGPDESGKFSKFAKANSRAPKKRSGKKVSDSSDSSAGEDDEDDEEVEEEEDDDDDEPPKKGKKKAGGKSKSDAFDSSTISSNDASLDSKKKTSKGTGRNNALFSLKESNQNLSFEKIARGSRKGINEREVEDEDEEEEEDGGKRGSRGKKKTAVNRSDIYSSSSEADDESDLSSKEGSDSDFVLSSSKKKSKINVTKVTGKGSLKSGKNQIEKSTVKKGEVETDDSFSDSVSEVSKNASKKGKTTTTAARNPKRKTSERVASVSKVADETDESDEDEKETMTASRSKGKKTVPPPAVALASSKAERKPPPDRASKGKNHMKTTKTQSAISSDSEPLMSPSPKETRSKVKDAGLEGHVTETPPRKQNTRSSVKKEASASPETDFKSNSKPKGKDAVKPQGQRTSQRMMNKSKEMFDEDLSKSGKDKGGKDGEAYKGEKECVSSDSEEPLSRKVEPKTEQMAEMREMFKKYISKLDMKEGDLKKESFKKKEYESSDSEGAAKESKLKQETESESEEAEKKNPKKCTKKSKTESLEEKVQRIKKQKNMVEEKKGKSKRSDEKEMKEKEETIVSSSSQEPITRSVAVQATRTDTPQEESQELVQKTERVAELEKELQLQLNTNKLLEVELNKTRVILDRIRSDHEDEISELNSKHVINISEIKKKQWCYNCETEAIYHCCWNTAYCSVECQQAHWQSEHKRVCRRKR